MSRISSIRNDSYQLIAGSYRFLERMVFGRKLIHTRISSFDRIDEGSKVLIVGGGNGAVLPFLPECGVVFLEPSEKMLEIARKIDCLPEVTFLHSRLEEFKSDGGFDHVLVHFVLDLYTEDQLKTVLPQLADHLKPGGFLHVSDFKLTGLSCRTHFYRILTRFMILFFRTFTDLKTDTLADIPGSIAQTDLLPISKITTSCGYIFNGVWQKAYTL